MQALRNFFFYFSPVLGAVLGVWIGLSFNFFAAVIEMLIGFGVGCLASIAMIALSIRARFKADPHLTRSVLEKSGPGGGSGAA